MIKRIMIAALAALPLTVNAANWAPAGDKIKTEFAQDVNPAAVLQEYPRPQAVRSEWVNLNGLWNYAITPAADAYTKPDGKILVPFAVESSLSGVARTVGEENALWYERKFTVPSSWKGRRVMLNFDAVDWSAQVWVNGKLVGEHTGGYTAFSFDITDALRKSGSQTLRVKVMDASDQTFQPRGKQVKNPNGIWYTPVTGIWQTVWMEPVAQTHVKSFFAVSDIATGNLTVNVDAAALGQGDKVLVDLLEGGVGYSAEKASSKILCSAEAVDGKAVLSIEQAMLWSPENPYLYGLKVRVERDGKVIDSVDGYTAFRKISKVWDQYGYQRLALNDNMYFMFGPLDQGWWPDGLYTAPTDEALKYDIVKTKEWGWNMIRKHIKVEPARWYYYCDMLGICVWQDMPCITDNSQNVWPNDSFMGGTQWNIPQNWKDNYYKEWGEIIAQLKGFQCITVWVPFNEGWGQFDTPAVVDFTRAQDPTRLINSASGGCFYFCGDIQDCHHYPNPVMRAVEREMVNVLGEYGGIGFPVKGHLWQGVSNWGYGGTKVSGEQVLSIYSDYAQQLINHIKTGCSAAVYTQTTDVEIEVNGIMTYDRKVIKVDEQEFARINKEVIASQQECDVRLLSRYNFLDAQGNHTLYNLHNGNVYMQVCTFGGRVVTLFTPDRNGHYDDIEIGYENLDRYVNNTGERFFGAAVGPVANRIGKGQFTIDGVQYNTPLNNNGNTLHGGLKGVDMLFWNVEAYDGKSITLSLDLADGFEGFPGNRHIEMTYELTEESEFVVSYKVTTDKTSPVNISHHSFFNLTGHADRSILGHVMQINASRTTPVDNLLIPSGEIVSLDGSPQDFRQPKAIGRDIYADDIQIANGGGYDHNWVLDRKTENEVEFAASVLEPVSGRYMEVWTDQPGLQFYSGNFFDGSYKDKYGRPVIYRGSIALETQKFPDGVNQPNFPSTILNPGEVYTHKCIYKFGAK